MKTAIITVAGISSRFNEGIPEEEKTLKAIYYEKEKKQTLLNHLISKCSSADRVIVVGGYKFEDLKAYVSSLSKEITEKTKLVYNGHFQDLGSGYSLYLGIEEAFREEVSEILFVEGDLDIDDASFAKVTASPETVITYNYEPIYANKAVVLYQTGDGTIHYAFNSSHGLLSIEAPFSFILNSGQVWKFTDMQKLREAWEWFGENAKDKTNLTLIKNYLDKGVTYELIGLSRWTNCNTRRDYQKIKAFWEEEK